MIKVLDALYAVRTRASLQPITAARRSAFFAATGLRRPLPTGSPAVSTSAAARPYFDPLHRDGVASLPAWRNVLTRLAGHDRGESRRRRLDGNGSRSGSDSGAVGAAGADAAAAQASWRVVPGTVQPYRHSYLRAPGTHGCGLRFVAHAPSPERSSPWADAPLQGVQPLRDRSSARLMVKATHSDNGHFDDESLYREIKVSAELSRAEVCSYLR
jgi:hypothetical protein